MVLAVFSVAPFRKVRTAPGPKNLNKKAAACLHSSETRRASPMRPGARLPRMMRAVYGAVAHDR